MTKMDAELLDVRREIVRMFSLASDITINAVKSAARMDAGTAREVIKEDEPIDALRFALDEKLLQSLALNHPMGVDLRSIASAMRILCDLERIGDYAVNIAKSVLKLLQESTAWMHPSIAEMGEICIDMMAESIDAYCTRDNDRARVISKRDDEIDAFYKEIEQYFEKDSSCIPSVCIQNVIIARAFERIADHITNICEWILFESFGVHEELN